MRPRLLLLLPTTTYRADAFLAAAARADADVTVASEFPSSLEAHNPEGLLTLDFAHPDRTMELAAQFGRAHGVTAVLGVDDRTATLAAAIGAALDLPGNPPDAVAAAGDKAEQRRRLSAAGVSVPEFMEATLADDPECLPGSVPFPCVVKPVSLSASRGVIRADGVAELATAHTRLAAILRAAFPECGDAQLRFLVERYVPGDEVAVEGLLVRGAFHPLAVFDKPDPLEGPYFAETIYVTPSRHRAAVKSAIIDVVARSCRALGLVEGPVHAEVRVDGSSSWLIELAARPIGGKCSLALRFGSAGDSSLEDLVIRHALGRLERVPDREPGASGVMMVPVQRRGRLTEVTGVERARAVPGVTDVLITAHRGQEMVPLPEGTRYAGFIFARGGSPARVEHAIRAAWDELELVLD